MDLLMDLPLAHLLTTLVEVEQHADAVALRCTLPPRPDFIRPALPVDAAGEAAPAVRVVEAVAVHIHRILPSLHAPSCAK